MKRWFLKWSSWYELFIFEIFHLIPEVSVHVLSQFAQTDFIEFKFSGKNNFDNSKLTLISYVML